MIKELIQDLDREDIFEIVGELIGWSGLFVICFMISVVCG